MQSQDEYRRIVSAYSGEQEAVMRKVADELKKKEVVAVRISKMPAKGSDFEINGLVFVVDYVDAKRGKLHLSLKKPNPYLGAESGFGQPPPL